MRPFWQGSLTRTVLVLFTAGTVLLVVYLALNLLSLDRIASMTGEILARQALVDESRQMQISFDEIELSTYQYLSGHQALDIAGTQTRLSTMMREIHAIRQTSIRAGQTNDLVLLQTHLERISRIVYNIESERLQESGMRQLYESFFVSRLLFRKISEAFFAVSRHNSKSMGSIVDGNRIFSLLILGTIVIFIIVLLGFRRLLVARLELFRENLLQLNGAPSPWPHDDEFRPLVTLYHEMTRNVNDSMREIALLKNCLRSMIDGMPSILVAIDRQGRIMQWNAAAAAETGITEKEALGRPLREVLLLLNSFHDELINAISQDTTMQIKREILRDGQHRYLSISAFPLGESHRNGTVLRIDDISDSERRENRMRQSQKMETIGTLAGGIAHNFNNILAGIVGTLSLMRHEKPLDEAVFEERMDTLELSSQRAIDMVQQILSLSRSHEVSMHTVDLNISIRHILQICRNTFDKSIEIVTAIPEGLVAVNADPVLLEQALLNIAVNAAHAMTLMRPGTTNRGGVMTVSLETRYLDELALATRGDKPAGKWWCLAIEDTGIGIPPPIQQRIFEPFFTTKQAGQGTGLGLSTCWSIIEQHRGFLQLYSEPGKGSRFMIWLPAAAPAGIAPPRESRPSLPVGDGLIMVVDDEELLRRTTQSMLEKCGWQVILAESGNEAIGLFRNWKDSITAILLDLTMPGKSGTETLRELLAIQPSACILLTSGFRQSDEIEAMIADGACGFIGKPFTLSSLANKLDEAIKARKNV